MKHLSTSLKAIVIASLTCSAGLAAAADSQTLAVSATVSAKCKFSAASTPLPFGTIDPSLTTDATATAAVKYRCTKNTVSGGITGTAGAHTMTSGSDTLAYTLAIVGDAGKGLGFGTGNDLTATVTGTITAAQYQNAAAGSYTENVTLNITP